MKHLEKEEWYIVAIVIAAWLLIPTGTPDDIITFWLTKKLGTQGYIAALGVVAALMYYYGITIKRAKRTMGSFVRRL